MKYDFTETAGQGEGQAIYGMKNAVTSSMEAAAAEGRLEVSVDHHSRPGASLATFSGRRRGGAGARSRDLVVEVSPYHWLSMTASPHHSISHQEEVR